MNETQPLPTDALAPCPFCGDAAMFGTMTDAKPFLIEKWNRRVPSRMEPAGDDCAGGIPCSDCPDKKACQRGCIRQPEFISVEYHAAQSKACHNSETVRANLEAVRGTTAHVGVEPMAEVHLKEQGGNAGIATVIREIYNPTREPLRAGDKLYTADQVLDMGREPLTRQQLREAFYNDTACTLGGDVDLAEKVCRVVEKAHGIKQGGQQ